MVPSIVVDSRILKEVIFCFHKEKQMNEFDPNRINMTHEEACTQTKAEILGDLSSFALALGAIEKGVQEDDSDD